MSAIPALCVGMIGANFMGRAHSNAWRQAPRFFDLPADIRLHTICARSPASLEKARADLGWEHASTDWRAVIADPAIDIVDICTPNDPHAAIAIAAAHHGNAILCEKPLALRISSAPLSRRKVSTPPSPMACKMKKSSPPLPKAPKNGSG